MPSLSEAYIGIAERHLLAARAALDTGIQEAAVFHAYHAFESVASGAISSRGAAVPRSHQAKLLRFTVLFRRNGFIFGAAALVPVLIPIRNQALYPGLSNEEPSSSFSIAQAEALLRRVTGLVTAIRRELAL